MKYKVGDKVRIKSIDWYNENKDEYGYIDCGSRAFFTKMSDWCGKIATIKEICKTNYYHLEEYDFDWTDEMIEGLVEEESANYSKVIDNGVSNPIIAKTSSATIDTDKGFYSYSDSDSNLEMEWNLPQGYQFKDENGIVINTNKIVLEKKKEYPKTYEECEKVLRYDSHRLNNMGVTVQGYKWELIRAFQILIICRDAYWKIAGEEMGLGKSWEPDWKNSEEKRYSIVNIEGDINLPEKTLTKWILKVTNKILVFPTEEMRDAFYENFKSEIEMCKELL